MPATAPHLKVRLWWDGYHPEILFTDPTYQFGLEHADPRQWDMRVMTAQDSTWRRPQSYLEDLIRYIEDHDLQVHQVDLVTSRRRGSWEGLFELAFGVGARKRPPPEEPGEPLF